MNHLFFASEATSGGLLGALGIDGRAILINTLAFLVIVAILGKFVYPSLVRALDAKKDELEAAATAEREAKEALVKAKKAADEILHEARVSADEVLGETRDEVAKMLEIAKTKALAAAERTAAEAREQLARDVEAARKALRVDAAKLVATATEVVLGEKIDEKSDAKLIDRSLEDKR